MDTRHFLTHASNKFVSLLLSNVAAHAGKHIIRNMLQGDIQILTNILLLTDYTQQIPWEVCGICIMQSDPLYSWNIGHLLDELSNMLLAIDVDTVICKFLSYNIKLLCALANKILNLIKDILHWATLVLTSNQRNSAISTMAIAALTNLDISIMTWGCDVTLTFANIEILAL